MNEDEQNEQDERHEQNEQAVRRCAVAPSQRWLLRPVLVIDRSYMLCAITL
jgi:hypothetical protein